MACSARVRNFGGCLTLLKSGLFQLGVKFEGANVESAILRSFHQAARAEAVMIALGHGC